MPRQHTSAPLRLSLLGSFRVENERGLIRLPTRKVESLLAYLVLYPEEHAREQLAALLWGDSPDALARNSLRTALGALRQLLDPELILADRDTVQLNRAFPLWVDVREFEKQIATSPLTALELYRGDLLLDSYDDWIAPERERLRTLYLETLLQFAVELRTRGEYARAIESAQKLLASDPTNEPAHRELMSCYAASGKRSAALKQYEECARILRAELDVEPSPETTALYLEIKRAASQPEATAPRRTNVPVPLNSFIGRTREMDRVQELIATQRLVTLTGAGGSGKTRLAIQVSTNLLDHFDDGVWWIELAALNDPALVSEATAKVLNVHVVPSQPLNEMLVRYLHSRRLLLVLDNCEHLIDACAELAETLLHACPNLKMLATSREALGIPGENVFQVPPLSLPTTLDLPLHQVLEHEATRLFVERASAVNPDLALTAQNARAVAQICQRLDGIPLAIELAAARAKLLTPEHIAARLNDRFNLLTHASRGALPRHQTLRGTIDWSYDLLADDSKILFRRLSVFAGGFTLDAAETVCSSAQIPSHALLDELARLVDRSLVFVEQRAVSERYRMLETIREYAREKLEENGEAGLVRDRHLEYFVQLAERAEAHTFGAESVQYFKQLDSELENIRAAMNWAIETRKATTAFRLAAGLNYYWAAGFYYIGYNRSSMSEWQGNLKRALSLKEGPNRSAERAKALNALGFLPWSEISPVNPRREIEQALAIGRELGDEAIVAQALCNLGLIENIQGNYANARSLLQQGLNLLRKLGAESRTEYIWALIFLGDVAWHKNDLNAAQVFYEECSNALREMHDRNFQAYLVRRLGQLAWHRGDPDEANARYRESLEMNLELGDERAIIACLSAFAGIALARGEAVQAAQLFGAVSAQLDARSTLLLQIDRIEFDRNVSNLRAQLDATTLEHTWTKGAEMTWEQAIDFALAITNP